MYPEDVVNSNELKVNNIIDIIGFLDRRIVQGDNDDLEEQSPISKEMHCIHTVQFKLFPNLFEESKELSM